MEPTNIDPTLIEAIKSAAGRWSNVIVGAVTPDFQVGSMEHALLPLDGAVDDLVIGFGIANTDGIDGTSFGLCSRLLIRCLRARGGIYPFGSTTGKNTKNESMNLNVTFTACHDATMCD